MITLDEAKKYLRVDFPDDDEYISHLIASAERLVKDVGRLTDEEFGKNEDSVRTGVLYTIAYLYEHREDADMHELTLMLRAILLGVRKQADYITCWATASGSGNETDAAGTTNPQETIDFTTRWCRALSEVTSDGYRIIADGKLYNILYVNPMGYKHNSLKFHCERVKR
jgi:uncharacterized phage protein (predicted DNA packaging)/SPP1 family predicted phage head-tail adaptor